MIIVDHVHTVSLFKPEAREIVFSLAAYQKKVRKNIDVIIPHAGKLNKIILRKYFDSLSDWDGYKKDMVLAIRTIPEAKKIRENLQNNPELFPSPVQRNIWEKLSD